MLVSSFPFILFCALRFNFFSLLICDFSVNLLLENSSYKCNEDINPTRANNVGTSHCQIGLTTRTGVERLYNTKYFIIKSLNHQNIRSSVEKGIWATQIMNEPILEEAFHVRSLLFLAQINLLKLFYIH